MHAYPGKCFSINKGSLRADGKTVSMANCAPHWPVRRFQTVAPGLKPRILLTAPGWRIIEGLGAIVNRLPTN